MADVFMDKIIDGMKQGDASEWFKKFKREEKGIGWFVIWDRDFQIAIRPPKLYGEVWKDSLGEAGKRGLGYTLLRFRSNFVMWVKGSSEKSHARYADR